MSTVREALSSAAGSAELEIDGRRLKLTNVDKVLWPRTETTKRDLLEYYDRIAPVLLPHIEDRPITLGRYPDGVEGVNWYQTTCPHPPAWIRTHPVGKRRGAGLSRDYCIINERAALLWAANLGSIELHPLLARGDRIDRPLSVVFDLDPGRGTTIVDCCRVALSVRDLLDEVGLRSFVKTSGSAGVHVYAPLNVDHSYADTKPFARSVARMVVRADPGLVVDRIQLGERQGKVLIDWGQNDAHRSTVAPYSLRGAPWPLASAPLAWGEVERAVELDVADGLVIDAASVLGRVQQRGDLFAPLLALRQALPGIEAG